MQTKLPPPERADWILGLLERHERALVAFATRRLGGDRERARDAVQETFLRLCRAERAQVEGRAAEWLHTVCRNLLHDWCRKEGKMKAQS